MITIDNKKMHDYIVAKDALVDEGRAVSKELEKIEVEITKCENEEKKITGSVKPDPALKAEGDALVVVFNQTLKKLEEIGSKIESKKLEAIPKTLMDKHKALLKQREEKERERNKIALKVQKVKDRVVPLIQKEVKPFLKEYDDIETAKTKNGMVVIATFNHLEDWKQKFKSK